MYITHTMLSSSLRYILDFRLRRSMDEKREIRVAHIHKDIMVLEPEAKQWYEIGRYGDDIYFLPGYLKPEHNYIVIEEREPERDEWDVLNMFYKERWYSSLIYPFPFDVSIHWKFFVFPCFVLLFVIFMFHILCLRLKYTQRKKIIIIIRS